MKKHGVFNFKVGDLAEVKSFEEGFRGAWFRCEIKDFRLKKNEVYLKCYDFDGEELSWEKIYQVPPYVGKSKSIQRHLMLRPQYPRVYHKSEMPPVDSISQPCVVTDGTWKVDDLVDWFKDRCYWSARVVKVLNNDKYQIELPMPPAGEGKPGKKGKLKASYKDLRPSLDWSAREGWTLSTVEGHTSCSARLIIPTKQGMDSEIEHAAGGSPSGGSSAGGSPLPGMDMEVEHAAVEGSAARVAVAGGSPPRESVAGSSPPGGSAAGDSPPVGLAAGGSPVNASSTTRISAEGIKESKQTEKDVKTDCGLVESSESISSSHVKKRRAEHDEVRNIVKRDLNIMREHTLEAAVLDLEEIINKVNWMQRLLRSPNTDGTTSTNGTTSSWKFA